jgi:hypothetical protein
MLNQVRFCFILIFGFSLLSLFLSETLESSLEVGSSLDLTLSISSNRDTKLSTANSASAASVARVLGYVTSSWTSNRFLGASIFLSLLLFCLQFVGMQVNISIFIPNVRFFSFLICCLFFVL